MDCQNMGRRPAPDEPALTGRSRPPAGGWGPLPPGESEAAAMGREKGMLQPGPGGEEERAQSRFTGTPEPCRDCAGGSV